MRRLFTAALLALVLGSAAGGRLHGQQPQGAERFDVLITGGRVLDGTGNPWFAADVGIRGGTIVAVGNLRGAQAERVIDATGRIVTPGFIDLHSHGDGPLRSDNPRLRAGPAAVTQGITTVVLNQDGRSPLPIAEQRATMERLGTGPNTLLLVGHGAVRGAVLGNDIRRPSTPQEVERMRALVREAMEQGAFGMSAGLEYSPGRWSETDEVVAMVSEIVPYGGVFVSHQRSEGSDPMWFWPSQDPASPPDLLDAVRESIEIGERTGATVVATHIKAKGEHYWGTADQVIRLIEDARARGVSIYADQYYYETTGSDGSTTLIPAWAYGGRAQDEDMATVLARTLADPRLGPDVRRDIEHEIRRRGGAPRIIVLDYPDDRFAGRNLEDLARERGLDPVDMAIALQMEGFRDRRGGAHLRGLSLSEIDIDLYAPMPWVATATDGSIALAGAGGGHPRSFGTFARKLRHFVLDRNVITLEHAIRAGTSLPAQILGLQDRGLIRPGMKADIVVIDLERVRDRGDFFEPRQYPDGFDWVLVNGVPVVERGAMTFALPGQLITPHSVGRGGVAY
jgi:N-acyl-D-amino-acid deacylase